MGNHSVWPHAHIRDQFCRHTNLRRTFPSVQKDSTEKVSEQYSSLSESYQLNKVRHESQVRHFDKKTLLAFVFKFCELPVLD